MHINEFLQKYRKVNDYGMNMIRPRVKCADGFTVSVQAGYGLYSEPRSDSDWYSRVELGYPSACDDELLGYAEEPNCPTETIYGFVPISVVDEVLKKHGGIVGADLSNCGAGEWQ